MASAERTPDAGGGATIVVLAAGIGRRFGGDKQLAAVGPRGETLLELTVGDAARAGFGRALLVLRPGLPEAEVGPVLERLGGLIGRVDTVEQRLDDLPPGRAAWREAALRRRRPWGTGHALWACRGSVDAPFAMANADDAYGPRSYPIARRAVEGLDGADRCALVAFDLGRTLSEHGEVSRGVCRLGDGGRVVDLVERHAIARDEVGRIVSRDGREPRVLPEDSPVSMNLWALPPAVFDWLGEAFELLLAGPPPGAADGAEPELMLSEVLGERLRSGRLRVDVHRTPEGWLGLTHPADLDLARRRLADRAGPDA